MCGIAGIIGHKANIHALESMLKIQNHRGPDHTGTFFVNGVCALGHNRLSILDLTEAANQPFVSPDRRYFLTFNGEIYNYIELRSKLKNKFTFKTQSDTEVLLYAYLEWGEACLDKLKGMFAFAVWDSHEKVLFAARDRFGVKPFYFSRQDDCFYFASEIKALFEAGIHKYPNEKVWSTFFAYGFNGTGKDSFWKDVFQLPSGSYLIYKDKELRIKRWYDFVQNVSQKGMPTKIDDVTERLMELYEETIRLRFRADVPVGFNLSGGVDSSFLLSMVLKFYGKENIQAFTFFTGDERYDELFWVEKMLENTGFQLNKCLIKSEEVPALTKKMSDHLCEPFGGIPTLAYSKLFSIARESGVLVLLDGQGSDEVWAGYDYYLQSEDKLVQGSKKSPVKPELLQKEFLMHSEYPDTVKPFENRILNLQYRDIFFSKLPRALKYNDMASMINSVELREPFLDHELMEFVFNLPMDFKIKDGVQKSYLRDISSKFLNNQISYAPKRPLQTPQREWLGNELSSWVMDHVNLLYKTGWLDKYQTEAALDNYMNGDQENSYFLWQLVNAAHCI
ncbi:asparagine synthase (glutamine-hydrolyzing) [Arthrospiribacter ruber]|uniref:asparagine synthase (glutamine-hydrolyzing) n=1 Tax=Arthrospiribacter ruber TaxID=2487934 RepID=A0A951IQ23_9BACT|nr:asparagine synthase (glutamine-hydrolyzing) [Arthrospiribacter ruber]MBW3466370.1 asparagine synthase (glutamine-hydrolyzing) [Arthrospiribacter ruber]